MRSWASRIGNQKPRNGTTITVHGASSTTNAIHTSWITTATSTRVECLIVNSIPLRSRFRFVWLNSTSWGQYSVLNQISTDALTIIITTVPGVGPVTALDMM